MVGLFSQSFPPKTKFAEGDVPDLNGLVAVVTGANTGIGKETARVLLSKNATVYLACRDEVKAKQAIAELKELTGKEGHFLKLDLGSVKSCVEASTQLIAETGGKLHLLFNNAGVMMPPAGSRTPDGLELQWATNVVGHYAFTEALLPSLIKTAAASPANTVRIINTSSSAHTMAVKGGVNLEDQTLGNKGGMPVYGQSKLGNVISSQYWAEKLKSDGVISISLNPGNISTDLARYMPGWLVAIGNATILHPVSLGAVTQLYAGTSPEVTMAQTGGYFIPWARVDKQARAEADDPVFCGKVMELIARQAQRDA